MQVSTSFIFTYFLITIYTHWVITENIPTYQITAFMNIAKSLADDKSLPDYGNMSQEFCRNSLKKQLRYRKIIMLQEQVNLKTQSQLLEQIQDCSNFRQRVRRLITKYKKVKTELKNLKASGCSAKGINQTVNK